jgi:methylmalonyl-CoA mutase C-terminal domain/subunit
MVIQDRRVKVLLAKSDQDAHDRGLRYIADVLQNAGMEVIFIRYRICDEVAKVALQEDVNVVGMSFYGSGYIHDVSKVTATLKENNKEVGMIVGGIIPREEWSKLKEMGVIGIFGPGIPTQNVITCITSYYN